jgi:hypothetical protein
MPIILMLQIYLKTILANKSEVDIKKEVAEQDNY